MRKFKFLKKIFTNIKYHEKRNFLAQLPMFKKFNIKDLTHLMGILKERIYLKDEVIFNKGDAARAMFIVYKGSVDIKMEGSEKKEKNIAQINAGEFFGEMALLEDVPRNASAAASEKTVVFMLFKNKLDDLICERNKIGVSILHHLAKILSARVRALAERMGQII